MQRFSAEGISKMVLSLDNIDKNTGVNGALVTSIKELTAAVVRQNKDKNIIRDGISAKDALALKVLGKSGLKGIGEGIKFIVTQVEAVKDAKNFALKLTAITDGLDKFTSIGRSILGFAGTFALAVPLLLLSAAAMPIVVSTLTLLGVGLLIAGKAMNKTTMDAMKDLALVGLTIVGFGLAMYIAKPLYEISVLPTVAMVGITLIGLAGAFWLMDKMNFTMNAVKIGIGIVAASVGIVTLGGALAIFRMAVPPNGDGWHTLAQATAAILLVGTLAFVAGLPGIDAAILVGGLVLTAAGIGLMAISAGLGIFRLAISPDAEGWTTIGQSTVAILGLGSAFAVAGLLSPFIMLGSIALGLAGLAMLPVSMGLLFMGSIAEVNGVQWLFKNSGKKSPVLRTPMTNLENMLQSLLWSFTFNLKTVALAYIGSSAVAKMGLALISIGKGVKEFQDIKIDYATFPKQVENLITVITKPFANIGKMGGISSPGSLLKLITGVGFDTFLPKNPVENGVAFVMGIGKAMSSIAVGVSAMSKLSYPIYNPDGSVKTFVSIGNGDFTNFAANMELLIVSVTRPFEKLGEKYRVNTKSWINYVIGSNFNGTHTLSPVESGIFMVKGIGKAAGDIFNAISNLAQFKLPIYDSNGNIVNYATMNGGPGTFTAFSNNLNDLIAAVVTPFATLGNQYPVKAQSWAAIVFGSNWDGTNNLNPVESGIAMVKGIGIAVSNILNGIELYVKNNLQKFDGKAFAGNMRNVITGLVGPFAEIGADTAPGWLKIFSENALDKGVQTMNKIVPNVEGLIRQAIIIQRIKFDHKLIETNLQGAITALTRPFVLLEQSQKNNNMHTPLTSLMLARNFESIAKSMQIISNNLNQWERTVAIFGEYELMQRNVTDSINRTNFKKLELIDSTFKSLVFLTKGPDNAIQVLGDKLIDALDGFAGIIDEFVMSIAEISAENGGMSAGDSSYSSDSGYNTTTQTTQTTTQSSSVNNSGEIVSELKVLGQKLDNIRSTLAR